MATKSKRVKSRRKTTSCLLTPIQGLLVPTKEMLLLGSSATKARLFGLSRSQTTGRTLSTSGGRSGTSLNHSRLKSDAYGRLSRTHCEICGQWTSRRCECAACSGCCTCKSRRRTVDDWLHKPIDSYQQLFKYLVPVLVECGYWRNQ